MKFTIIPSDGAVYKNGVSFLELTWEGTPSNVHALQWQDTNGWIEFNDGSQNQYIDVLPTWALNAELAWDNANDENINNSLPTTESLIQNCKNKAESILLNTDWSEIPSVTNVENNPHLLNGQDFINYRIEIRKLAINPVENPIWPNKPNAQWSS